MIIANPLYDVVFKYLLEDLDIVREFLSAFLGEEIESVQLKPQETLEENAKSDLSVLRIDFKAVIKTAAGEHKKVLIELQKAKQTQDVMRFRRYLGDNYRREENAVVNGKPVRLPLPIVTIYILGFRLENLQLPVVKIHRQYRDGVTQEPIEAKEDFVEWLTHDSHVIQIPRLKRQTRTKLESALQVFSQEYRTDDFHQLDFKGDADDPLVKKMIERLRRAVSSDELRNLMDLEDDLDRMFAENARLLADETERAEREKAEKEAALVKAEAEKQRANAEKQRAEAEKQRANAEKQRAETEKQRAETEKQRADNLQRRLDDLEKRLNN